MSYSVEESYLSITLLLRVDGFYPLVLYTSSRGAQVSKECFMVTNLSAYGRHIVPIEIFEVVNKSRLKENVKIQSSKNLFQQILTSANI